MRTSGLLFASVAAALAAPSGASATTFCVPAFTAGCPDNGTNVAQPDLQVALTTDGSDGQPDSIVLAAGTFTRADSWELTGTDALEIAGAGRGATEITTSDTVNAFVMNLSGSRAVTAHDFTIVIPASFPDGLGSALQARKGDFEHVDIESRNAHSGGASSMVGGGTFRDGRIYGAQGGSISDGIGTSGAASGSLTIERTSIENAQSGIVASDANVSVFARRVHIPDPEQYGLRVQHGGFAVLENSLIHVTGLAHAVDAEGTDAGTVIATVRHTTIVGDNLADPGVPAIVSLTYPADGSVNLVIRDSIVAGFTKPFLRHSPDGGNDADLTVIYSHVAFTPTDDSGPGTLSIQNSIDASSSDPLFVGAGDYHLQPGSPAIDAADPQTVGQLTEDYDGLLRPVDGNGDGAVRRDMGAFEYHVPEPQQPPGDPGTPVDPGTPQPQPTPGATDTTAPRITRLGLGRGLRVRRGGSVSLTLSEAATVTLRFRPLHGRGRTLKVTFNGKAGPNRVRIRARTLKARRYRLTVTATDAAGNRSAALTKKVRVRR